jgi:formylglycine-generating enzyme required for sulfatase activity
MEFVLLAELQVAVSAKPVSWAEYAPFAEETGRPVPRRTGLRTSPVTGISAADALAFGQWLGQHEGRSYRLPRPKELIALAHQTQGGPDIWPCHSSERNGLERYSDGCLAEWLTCLSGRAGQNDSLHCVMHPAWLLGKGKVIGRGALADGKYSFVTFRVVREADS